MKIFAYGSNMNLNRLKERVPSAKKVAIGYIEGYELKCVKKSIDGSGKATVLESNEIENRVWGVVFEIEENEKKDLDKAEGLNYGYNESLIKVNIEEETLNAQIYIADENAIDDKLNAYDWYKGFILSGAENNELPKEYRDKLHNIKSSKDPNEDRRNKNMNILEGKKQ